MLVGRFEVQPARWFDVLQFSRPFFLGGDGFTPPTSEALHWRYLTFQVHVRHIQKEPWPHTHVTKCAMVRTKRTVPGWWFGTCFSFPSIGNVIIPTDELICFRGVPSGKLT